MTAAVAVRRNGFSVRFNGLPYRRRLNGTVDGCAERLRWRILVFPPFFRFLKVAKSHFLSTLVVLVSGVAFGQNFAPTAPQAYVSKDTAAAAVGSQEVCESATTFVPPFYASFADANGNNSATVRAEDRPEVTSYLPRNSIVKVQNPNSYDQAAADDFVGIEVVSVPNAKTDFNARLSPSEIRNLVLPNNRKLKPAVGGARGAIAKKNLVAAGNFQFVVGSDAPLLQFPGGGSMAVAGRALRLARTLTGGYAVNRCCRITAEQQNRHWYSPTDQFNNAKESLQRLNNTNPNCHNNYVFEVLGEGLNCVKGRFAMGDAAACTQFSSSLRAVFPNQLAAIMTVSKAAKSLGWGPQNLEYVDTAGMLKLPFDPQTGKGPFNSMHYTASGSPTAKNLLSLSYDTFMRTYSACALMRVLEANSKICQGAGCQVKIGDSFSPAAWGDHPAEARSPATDSGHKGGSCVDVAPLGTPEKTMALIDLMIKAGAKRDQLGYKNQLAFARFRTKQWSGHETHIHVCFPDESTQVKGACQNGIPQPGAKPTGFSGIVPGGTALYGLSECK